jgi:hypothetical protein
MATPRDCRRIDTGGAVERAAGAASLVQHIEPVAESAVTTVEVAHDRCGDRTPALA